MNMTIQAINQANPQIKTQTFKQTIPEEPVIQEKKNNKTPWVLGGLTALAALGVYCIARGRNKSVQKEATEAVKELKEITFDAFISAGNKFEKGKAKLANGDKFDGIIKATNSDGSTLTLEYRNGILQKSNKTQNGKKVFEKTFTHDINGNLQSVLNKENKTLSIKTENGEKTIKTTTGNTIKYNIEKKKILSQENSGSIRKDYYYRNNENNTLKYIREGEKITKYDKDGKTIVYTITKDQAEGNSELLTNLFEKFNFSEIKDLKSYLIDKYARLTGKITVGTPIEMPKIEFPTKNDVVKTASEFFEKLKYKKAFAETKDNHFLY